MTDPRTASTQYGDFRGESSADRQLESGLAGLARDLGVPGFPVGFSFTRLNDANQSDEDAADDEVYLSIYTADRDAGYGVDDINAYVREHGGTLLVTEHHTSISLLKFLRYFKRLNVTFFSKGIKVDSVEVSEQVSLEDQHDDEEE